jgi:hypothetical protein
MPSRIRIGPDGGPYVIVEEDNGDVNISSPNGNVDFQTDDISNVGALTADSLSTADLSGDYPSQIRLIRDSGVVTTTDPATTTDPVQTTLDQSQRGDMLVFPPNASITESGPIYPRSDQTWYPNGAEITITGNSGGLVIDGNHYGQGFNFLFGTEIRGNLSIIGQGPNSGQGGHLLHRKDGMADWRVGGRLFLGKFDGVAWKDDSGSSSYQNQFNHIKINDVDAGDEEGVMDFQSGGAPEQVNYLTIYPDDAGSGSDSLLINGDTGPPWIVGVINIDGSAGRIIDYNVGSSHGFHVGHINYEPSEQNSAATSLLRDVGASPFRIGSITLITGSTDYVYDAFNTNNVYFGPVRVQGGTINTNHVLIRNSIGTNATATYAGPSSQVDNGNGGRGLACLSDLTLKQ